MPRLPGRESTFKLYPLEELLVGYWLGPVPGATFRCCHCGKTWDGNAWGVSNWGARVVLEAGATDQTVGEICPDCTDELEQLHYPKDGL